MTLPLGAGREGEAVRVASPADGSGTHHLGNPQSDVKHGLLSGRVIWYVGCRAGMPGAVGCGRVREGASG